MTEYSSSRFYLWLVFLVTLPGWSQTDPSATGGLNPSDDGARMKTPPPVSGEAYPTVVGSQMRTNYLSAGIFYESAYNDNVQPGSSLKPVSDVTYFFTPTISLNQTTSRVRNSLRYSPGFRLYQRTNTLNAVNQTADFSFEYRMSPYTTLSVQNIFQQNSNAFNQPFISGSQVSGSTQFPGTGVIAPYANTLSETARVNVTYQFGRNAMIGGGGSFALLNYPKPEQATGLYNFNSIGGTAFYNRRLSRAQYMGATYQYTKTETDPVSANTPVGTTVQTNGIFLFYTLYVGPSFSMSLSPGAQHLDYIIPGAATTKSWTPSGMASIGWQVSHFNFAGSYSRTISAGNGFNGALNLTNANAFVSWQISRNWTSRLVGLYMNTENANSLSPSTISQGHSASGGFLIQRRIGENFTAIAGYTHLQQHYQNIAAISSAPNSNREYLSIAYTFTRPVGR